ncbi:hypothetical protein E6H32_06485 [Candidatus Bathyarchaeota archaeon]|nr:MAG: hypothetical protein E6H32_06485 [Candidatus Bathyarchaeota archaeon]
MRIMGIGGGAREHAIAWKLGLSDHKPEIFWIAENRNPGIHKICRDNQGELRTGRTTDAKTIVRSARGWGIDMVVVGPEEPGFHGIPDALEKEGVHCIGATQELSVIERSKASFCFEPSRTHEKPQTVFGKTSNLSPGFRTSSSSPPVNPAVRALN